MRSKTCCFTGHRHLPENQKEKIALALENAVLSFIHSGYRYFGAGGALGFDYEKRKVMRSEVLDAA